MSPIVARALTAALATAGAVWAIVLPTLTLGEARSPAHAFAIPAPAGVVVIEASPVPQLVTARPAPTTARQRTASRPAPTRAVIVVATPARSRPPVVSSHPVARVSKPVAPPVSAASPQALPVPTPAPQPQPAPEPTARTLASVPAQPTDLTADDSKRHKQHKDKTHKEKKSKHERARKDDVTLLEAAPPAAGPVTPVEPVEPAAAEEADQEESGQDESSEDDHDKERHGKGHDKKK